MCLFHREHADPRGVFERIQKLHGSGVSDPAA